MMSLKVAKLSEKAIIPVRGSALSAGYDLASAYDCVVPSMGKSLLKTDLAIAVPPHCYGRIAPRSGLAWKKHIDVGAGVIDADYRGNVGVVLFNHSNEDLHVKAGDRIAQLVLEKIEMLDIEEVAEKDLSQTERGAGGFGSTGVAKTIKRQKVMADDPTQANEDDAFVDACSELLVFLSQTDKFDESQKRMLKKMILVNRNPVILSVIKANKVLNNETELIDSLQVLLNA